MTKAVLVTGAAGFVGSRTAEILQKEGYDVTRVDIAGGEGSGVLACDLCDLEELLRIESGKGFGAIVHCGAISGPALHRDDPSRVAGANTTGTLNLLEFARRRFVSRFIFASSASVYGATPPDLEVSEERALHPSTPYAASKVAGEALLEAYCRQYDMSGASLRIAAVYGPGRRTPCFIRDMIVAGLENRPLSLAIGGRQRYHYVHIDDVAAALRAAVTAPSFGSPAYTIAADRGFTLQEVAQEVRKVVPGPPITVGPALDPLSDPQGPYSIEAALRDLDWRPAIDLPTGIRSYADGLLQRS
ncbi:MAG TPA: NAD(P)-dependent oxidoreductase [Rhizobiaceae bacterium]|nr:NAD(P)-dependent oxidoreductase [Rhizobiaceae bacterium]